MPSTTSKASSKPEPSSTVITPSLPTFSIASAINLPTVLSEFAEIEPTCSIALKSSAALALVLMLSTTVRTARSIPRFKSVGFIPAVTDLIPSAKIACASTVAVVVPSPATSLVFEDTSRTS